MWTGLQSPSLGVKFEILYELHLSRSRWQLDINMDAMIWNPLTIKDTFQAPELRTIHAHHILGTFSFIYIFC